jgi:hypothetical protein
MMARLMSGERKITDAAASRTGSDSAADRQQDTGVGCFPCIGGRIPTMNLITSVKTCQGGGHRRL